MGNKKSTLAVMTKVRQLSKYIFDACEKSPKKYRFSLCNRLCNFSLDSIELIYRANCEKDINRRLILQDKAKSSIAMTDYFANLACELNCITIHQYEVISLAIAESLKLLVVWMNSTKKNLVVLTQ